jgi:hypothetical protein
MRKARQLPNWLHSFEQVYQNTEPPEKYVFWVGVGVLGGALQRNAWFDEVTFRLFPNHYIVLVGPPAVKKTTAIYYGVDRLKKLEGSVDGINIGPSSVTWQNAVDLMEEIQTPSAEETARTGVALRDSCPIIFPAGELGTLIDFELRDAIDFFTNAWDSPDTFLKSTRIMGKQNINGPCPTIIAGTTPQWVKDNVKGSTRGGGFISRCIMPYASRPRRTIAYPSEHIKHDHDAMLSSLEHDLAIVSTLRGRFKMEKDARDYGREWHTTTQEASFQKYIFDDSDNWANRRYAHVHKLAMVLSVAERDDLIITKHHMETAVHYVNKVHEDFNSVFALMDQRPETKPMREIVAFMQEKKHVSMTDLVNHFMRKYTKKEITDVLELLIMGGSAKKTIVNLTNAAGGIMPVMVLTWVGEMEL